MKLNMMISSMKLRQRIPYLFIFFHSEQDEDNEQDQDSEYNEDVRI